MLQSINVLNVGFGDSSILSGLKFDDEYKVLVDCGSKHRCDHRIINFINNDFANKKSFGILSHFHSDHYKYIPKLNPIFDEFYLPNYLNVQNISIQLKTFLLIKSDSEIKQAAKAMLCLEKISRCLKPNGKLIFVSSSQQKKTHIIDNYRVLWPLKDNLPNDSVLNDRLNYYFTEDQLNQINDFSEEFVTHFEENAEDDHEGRSSIIGDKVPNIEDRLNSLSSNIIPKQITAGPSVYKTEDKTTDMNTLFTPEKQHIDWTITNGILENQHSYCLVFDKIDNDAISILFLGDIDKKILKNNLLPDISQNHYKYIKVVHHGTEAYFIPNLPKSDFFIISNKKWGNYKSWRIYDEYPKNYLHTSFICTNRDGCAFFKSKGKCNNNTHCGFGTSLYKLLN